jgi:ATP-dependent exoDNAse (exonuclease V) beta subunit
VDNDRFISKPLNTNWRSRSDIIKFNNALFTIIPQQLDETFSGESLPVSFKTLYSEAIQTDPCKRSGGYIRLEFIENGKEQKWQEIILEKLPLVIETFQDKGYKASDIGIIVRDGKEGALVMKSLIDYSNSSSTEKKKRYNFNVVSNDSLLLSNSPVINFIVAAISVINNPDDMIARALMLRFYLLSSGNEEADKVPLVRDNLIEISRKYFPDGFEAFLEQLRQLPLFEATESIIRFFALGDHSWNVAYLNTFQDYIVSFTGNKNGDIQSFLNWWESTGIRKSVVLPGNQDAIRILTIHKSKGLEFKVVILPFLSWNLDHISSKQPVLWVKPDIPPFNELGIIPVKYCKELSKTVFAEDYREEKYSVYLDNINLLYVAFTRAKDAIYGFSVDNPKSEATIAGLLKNVLTLKSDINDLSEFSLNSFYDTESGAFEFGKIPENQGEVSDNVSLISSVYSVSNETEALKLRLHGENYFSSERVEVRKKINYGKLMHEIFEGINVPADISFAIKKLVLEGKLPEEDSAEIENKMNDLIRTPEVEGWFLPGNEVLREAGILLPSGNTKRPDRVIIKDGKAIIIDFKFGEENPKYSEQVDNYRRLLADMGYNNIEAFLWYVDKNLIVNVYH